MASQNGEDRGPREQADGFDLTAGGENDGLWDWNLATGRIRFSPRWIAMLGYGADELGNTPEEWFRRVHPDDAKRVQLDVDGLLAGNPLRFENEHRLLHKDGTYRWMSCRAMVAVGEEGRPTRMSGSHSDTTAGRVVDALTGLPNRVLFMDRLGRSFEKARRQKDSTLALIFLDLDGFKLINDSYGHLIGDQLLVAIANRLETTVRSSDCVARLGRNHTIARLGGDEFTILLEDISGAEDATRVAERISHALAAPFAAPAIDGDGEITKSDRSHVVL